MRTIATAAFAALLTLAYHPVLAQQQNDKQQVCSVLGKPVDCAALAPVFAQQRVWRQEVIEALDRCLETPIDWAYKTSSGSFDDRIRAVDKAAQRACRPLLNSQMLRLYFRTKEARDDLFDNEEAMIINVVIARYR